MLLLRIGRRGRWANRSPQKETDVAEAARDLELRDEEGLSVYRVDDETQARELALAWAVEMRERDDNADYIVFDEGVAAATHRLEQRNDDNVVDERLRSLHHELIPTSQDAAKALARKLLEGEAVRVERVPQRDVAAERERRRGRGP